MSSASRRSWHPGRRLNNDSTRDPGRLRGSSRQQIVVEHEDARSFAVRAAYLHYLLQPKAKRKQYVPAPKQPARTGSSLGQLLQEGTTSSSSKLPHNFAAPVLDRVGGVLRGSERLPGYNDAAVKRSFAEAYTAFSEKNFRKSIDKERKLEPLILIFFSASSKASQKGRAPEDDSWKLLPDRHTAMFIRLIANILKDHGHDRDKPELMSRLNTLENKLLTNDQNLVGGGADGAGTTIEVVVPLSYDVKDMPMVQVVAGIFGMSFSEVQAEINDNRQVWTEEAALKDLKTYQTRLNSNMPGALRSQDFDVEDAFLEWKKAETPHLSQMMLDILTAKPELAKSSTSTVDKPLPNRPQSTFNDQAYADLGRALSSAGDGALDFDPSLNLGSLSLGDSGASASDEEIYTFIPPDPRAFYKYILKHAMTFDQIHADPELDFQPLSRQSLDFLTELCVRWRIPQSSRLITVLEVAARMFVDQEIVSQELDGIFDFLNEPMPEPKKAPHVTHHSLPLSEIDPSRWTIHDFAAYQHTLHMLHDTILREVVQVMDQCYETKAPPVGILLFILDKHIHGDPNFSPRSNSVAEFAEHLSQILQQRAADAYRDYMEKEIPISKDDWEFGHVVKLGKSVIKLCERIKKRYAKFGKILGVVDPFEILVAETFPNFEEDASAIIESILLSAQDRGEDIDIEDGFELYRELVAIRQIHHESLPDRPFAFNIEDSLASFVWRWIAAAEATMEDWVERAIKQDQFQVRTQDPNNISLDSERHSVSIIDMFMFFNQTIDQVFKLNWDNDEHHARFMTALARIFSTGIGKYCEIVDDRFAKEMDRPSVEELAAQNRTTQEKWMQYAKDAWNSKDRPEPFQFYAEVSAV